MNKNIISGIVLAGVLVVGATFMSSLVSSATTFSKVDKNTIEVKETIPQEIIPAKVEITKYKYEFLLEQRIRIQADYDRDAATLALRQAELDEINLLIAEAEKLGITQ